MEQKAATQEMQAAQPANNAETKETYTPAKNERNLYHVRLDKPLFDKRTGKKISVPYVQKFTEKEYNDLVGKKSEKDMSNAEMLGYTVEVLWNPKENI